MAPRFADNRHVRIPLGAHPNPRPRPHPHFHSLSGSPALSPNFSATLEAKSPERHSTSGFAKSLAVWATEVGAGAICDANFCVKVSILGYERSKVNAFGSSFQALDAFD